MNLAQKMHLQFGGFLILSHLLTSLADGAETIVFRADFETPTTAAPPGGWSMWGAQIYKDPANFTRDAQQPHDGAASFRLHHPAHTVTAGGLPYPAPDGVHQPQLLEIRGPKVIDESAQLAGT